MNYPSVKPRLMNGVWHAVFAHRTVPCASRAIATRVIRAELHRTLIGGEQIGTTSQR